jgi:lysyl-tRNA synthetase class 2
MMAINRFGKSAFIRFKDRTGLMQAYVRKDKVGDPGYDLFKRLDVGDFVEITGEACFAPRPANGRFWPPPLNSSASPPGPFPRSFMGLKIRKNATGSATST